MLKTASRNHTTQLVALFLMVALVLTLPLIGWAANDRQLGSGPLSLSLRGGAINDSAALGVDGRLDYLNQFLNLHLFGTFDWLNAGRGEGQIHNTRFGGGLALSHTFNRRANIFAGTSYISEMNADFGHAYLGGKVKVADFALLSASYGFGFDKAQEIQRFTSSYLAAEAVDWLKVGAVLVSGQGLKANAYYHLTDPGGEKISGVEGEVSYAILDYLTVGANGSCDLTEKGDLERNWRTALFVTYAFGSQKGSPIDIALDKNNPIEYPQIIRKVVQNAGSPPPAKQLSILPISASVNGCSQSGSTGTATFQAVGGTAPYTWNVSSGPSSNLTPSSDTSSASWYDGTNAFCQTKYNGTIISITVTDENGATATVPLTVIVNPA